MIKKTIFISSLLFSLSCFAGTSCPQALPTDNPGFCASFKESALCHCTSSGLPRSVCQDMKLLYDRMISIFGTLERACEYQRDTSKQNCIDDWNCYRLGGKDSQGRLCSSTGKSC